MKHLEALKFEKHPNYQTSVHLKEVVLKMEKLHVLLSLVLSLLQLFVLFYFSQFSEEINIIKKKKTHNKFKNTFKQKFYLKNIKINESFYKNE